MRLYSTEATEEGLQEMIIGGKARALNEHKGLKCSLRCQMQSAAMSDGVLGQEGHGEDT